MKFKLLSLIFLSSVILADNFRKQLFIPSVDINNPFWEFTHQPITQKQDGDFAQLIEKWNKTLNTLWTKFSRKVRDDLNISAEQIDYYLNDQRFINSYLNYQKQIYPECIDEKLEFEEIEEVVLNFIQLKLYYLQLYKPVKIFGRENISLLTNSFGADKAGHYLIINKNIYTAEKIRSMYESEIEKTNQYYIEPHTNLHKSRVIEISNLLHFGIAQAISSVIHQGDFFAKVLTIFTYNKKQLSKATQTYGIDYVHFQSYLEACLQSKNPLEVALFLEPKLGDFNQEFILLWRDFIEDIQNCYDPKDLDAYESFSLRERRSILYTHQDE